jgi:hypothetical protein
MAPVAQTVARLWADDLGYIVIIRSKRSSNPRPSPFANPTPDFIALWILDEMRSSAFRPVAPQHPNWLLETSAASETSRAKAQRLSLRQIHMGP